MVYELFQLIIEAVFIPIAESYSIETTIRRSSWIETSVQFRKIRMVKCQGSQLYSATIKNRDTHEIKTTGLPAGVYIVHLYKNGKELGAVQVVKQ